MISALIISKDPKYLELLIHLLRHAQQLKVREDVSRAVDFFGQFNLIILDLDLPYIDWGSVMDALEAKGGKPRVLLLSSQEEDSTFESYNCCGYFVNKEPFTQRFLIQGFSSILTQDPNVIPPKKPCGCKKNKG